ncbi:nitrate ABC transporter ATP-binding protein [Clostridium botulinum]|uniref:nitrate ABC transporter ATP-binding protein n=1 Tax=Clostridium botulinum TaxID=1491 RepID=UPI000957ADA8|nr:nitrate ABC transporter ATP-binding protein [Clostridium botulinum]APU60211.1 putative nitrate transport ATP-binding protein NrtD [Clostridium botulinum]
MTDIKLFERWVKNALKNTFVFNPYKEFFIVIDGYTGFKIPNKFSSYKKVIKKQTFQSLKSGFCVKNGELKKWDSLNALKHFDMANKTKATMLPFVYEKSDKMQIFKANNDLIFINKELLKNINIENYEIYAESPVTPLVFKSQDITYITLPIMMNGFRYTIEENKESQDAFNDFR